MTDLPWDRFEPDEPDELPYKPPGVLPTPTPPPPLILDPEELDPAPLPPAPPSGVEEPRTPDWGDILDEAWPMIRDQVVDYARAVVATTVKGNQVDFAHPQVTAVTKQGKELVIADARSRSWRTLIQGLIFDVFAAVLAAIAVLSGLDPLVKETWIAFGVLLAKSVISAIISYFMRLKVTPTIKNKEGEKMAVMPIPRPVLPQEQT